MSEHSIFLLLLVIIFINAVGGLHPSYRRHASYGVSWLSIALIGVILYITGHLS